MPPIDLTPAPSSCLSSPLVPSWVTRTAVLSSRQQQQLSSGRPSASLWHRRRPPAWAWRWCPGGSRGPPAAQCQCHACGRSPQRRRCSKLHTDFKVGIRTRQGGSRNRQRQSVDVAFAANRLDAAAAGKVQGQCNQRESACRGGFNELRSCMLVIAMPQVVPHIAIRLCSAGLA